MGRSKSGGRPRQAPRGFAELRWQFDRTPHELPGEVEVGPDGTAIVPADKVSHVPGRRAIWGMDGEVVYFDDAVDVALVQRGWTSDRGSEFHEGVGDYWWWPGTRADWPEECHPTVTLTRDGLLGHGPIASGKHQQFNDLDHILQHLDEIEAWITPDRVTPVTGCRPAWGQHGVVYLCDAADRSLVAQGWFSRREDVENLLSESGDGWAWYDELLEGGAEPHIQITSRGFEASGPRGEHRVFTTLEDLLANIEQVKAWLDTTMVREDRIAEAVALGWIPAEALDAVSENQNTAAGLDRNGEARRG